ncbi:type III polyketide synthase [Mycobacterium shinjukuense]|uniref:type III polyketide synthase n=1 Tax=Mycobacterium shinjukuense TaxID=398694 RepID=UPI0035562147
MNPSGGSTVTAYMDTITGGNLACLGAETPTATTTRDPSVAAVAVKFPQHRHSQDATINALTEFAGPEFRRFALSSGVRARHTALPLSRYRQLSGFTEANDAFVDVALDVGEQALRAALDEAEVRPSEIDIVFSTTVTGLAVPTLEARLATRVGLRQDKSVANLIATSLFGDGAAAVVLQGAARTAVGSVGLPKVLATRSRLYPGTEEVMGWKIGSDGFRIVLSVDVATVTEKYLGNDVRRFLADHGLTTDDVTTWVCHPGGPRVIEAVENALELPADALDDTRKSLRDNGNLSSVWVLDVLRAAMADPPPPGSIGVMIAMGPAFCSELVLLKW